MDENTNLGSIIRRERQKHALSRDDLAALIGCDARTVARWELGETIPRPFHRKRLMELGFIQERTTDNFTEEQYDKLRDLVLEFFENDACNLPIVRKRTTDDFTDAAYSEVRNTIQENFVYRSAKSVPPGEIYRYPVPPPPQLSSSSKIHWTPIILATIWLVALTGLMIVLLVLTVMYSNNFFLYGMLLILMIVMDIGPIHILMKTANAYLPSESDSGSLLVTLYRKLMSKRKPAAPEEEDHAFLESNLEPRQSTTTYR